MNEDLKAELAIRDKNPVRYFRYALTSDLQEALRSKSHGKNVALSIEALIDAKVQQILYGKPPAKKWVK